MIPAIHRSRIHMTNYYYIVYGFTFPPSGSRWPLPSKYIISNLYTIFPFPPAPTDPFLQYIKYKLTHCLPPLTGSRRPLLSKYVIINSHTVFPLPLAPVGPFLHMHKNNTICTYNITYTSTNKVTLSMSVAL